MQKSMLALGLDGKNLTDTDIFSKSDPYVVISRRRKEDGRWLPIKKSETIKNNLNPRWSEFLIDETELPGAYEDLKFEVFDAGWKKDTSIGVGHFSICKLEHANKTGTPLPIYTRGRKNRILQSLPGPNISLLLMETPKTDKRLKCGGEIVVRSFRMDVGGSDNGSGSACPSQDVSGGGFTHPGGNSKPSSPSHEMMQSRGVTPPPDADSHWIEEHGDLCNLPDLVLDIIAEYLEPKDILHLLDSCPCFEDFRRFLPKYQEINGEDFRKEQHPNQRDGDGDCDGINPEKYFDGPEMNQGAKSIKLNFRWKDQVKFQIWSFQLILLIFLYCFQGWGHRKGQVWIQLIRNEEVLVDSRKQFHELAPHEYREREVVIKEHPVVDLLKKGDKIRFMRAVGGGGGHSLTVKNFKVVVELKRY